MGEKYKIKVGEGGMVKLPEEVRRLFSVREGKEFTVEMTVEGILIQPVWDERMEVYTDERIAEFLLTNAIDAEDYELARVEVVKMGLHPDQIEHVKPGPRPDWVDLVEEYTDERIAEFLLTNSIGEDEYQRMRKEVVKMGLDPDKILHIKPDGTRVEGAE